MIYIVDSSNCSQLRELYWMQTEKFKIYKNIKYKNQTLRVPESSSIHIKLKEYHNLKSCKNYVDSRVEQVDSRVEQILFI